MERAGAGSGGVPPRGFVADLASLAQVRRLAEEVKSSCPSIDVLINNAGVFEQQLRKSQVGGWRHAGVARGGCKGGCKVAAAACIAALKPSGHC